MFILPLPFLRRRLKACIFLLVHPACWLGLRAPPGRQAPSSPLLCSDFPLLCETGFLACVEGGIVSVGAIHPYSTGLVLWLFSGGLCPLELHPTVLNTGPVAVLWSTMSAGTPMAGSCRVEHVALNCELPTFSATQEQLHRQELG